MYHSLLISGDNIPHARDPSLRSEDGVSFQSIWTIHRWSSSQADNRSRRIILVLNITRPVPPIIFIIVFSFGYQINASHGPTHYHFIPAIFSQVCWAQSSMWGRCRWGSEVWSSTSDLLSVVALSPEWAPLSCWIARVQTDPSHLSWLVPAYDHPTLRIFLLILGWRMFNLLLKIFVSGNSYTIPVGVGSLCLFETDRDDNENHSELQTPRCDELTSSLETIDTIHWLALIFFFLTICTRLLSTFHNIGTLGLKIGSQDHAPDFP